MNGTDAFTLVLVAELVCVAMAAAEGEGHTAADVVVVVPPGHGHTARTRVHRQRTHVCMKQTSVQSNLTVDGIAPIAAPNALLRRGRYVILVSPVVDDGEAPRLDEIIM